MMVRGIGTVLLLVSVSVTAASSQVRVLPADSLGSSISDTKKA